LSALSLATSARPRVVSAANVFASFASDVLPAL
jgi:hypothetical protein